MKEQGKPKETPKGDAEPEPEEGKHDVTRKLTKADRFVYTTILDNVTEDVHKYLIGIKPGDGIAAWKALLVEFEGATRGRRRMLLKRYLNFKKSEEDDMAACLASMDIIERGINKANGNSGTCTTCGKGPALLDEDLKIAVLITACEGFEEFKTALEVINLDDSLNYDAVAKKLKAAEWKMKGVTTRTSVNNAKCLLQATNLVGTEIAQETQTKGALCARKQIIGKESAITRANTARKQEIIMNQSVFTGQGVNTNQERLRQKMLRVTYVLKMSRPGLYLQETTMLP